MISSLEAEQLIRDNMIPCPSKSVSLELALGKSLAEDILASRAQPPFDRVMMDGISVGYQALKNSKSFKIAGVVGAGEQSPDSCERDSCFEVMTGAMLPKCHNVVIPYEHLEITDGVATIVSNESYQANQFVHQQGSDYQVGDVLLKKGQKISASQIGVLATNGNEKIKVACNYSVAVISTGDELVDVGETPQDHQIRMSNPYALKALLNSFAIDNVSLMHLSDDEKLIEKKLAEILENFEVVVITGGVSKGKYDYIPSVLERLGVEKIFHTVRHRPGKPMWFGKKENRAVVFGLPGNPISSLITMRRYVIPALTGHKQKIEFAQLTTDYKYKRDYTYYLLVNSSQEEGVRLVTPLQSNCSGDVGALASADGFVELNRERDEFGKGELFPFYGW